MTASRKVPEEHPLPASKKHPSTSHARAIALGVGILVVTAAISYALLSGHWVTKRLFSAQPTTAQTGAGSPDQPTESSKSELHLTREGIHLLLDALDQAIRRKDVDGVLRLIAPDATITIHMRQGAQQQFATLSREEYRRTLAMGFAFPSANDYARVNTTVALAPDERSAKISFKTIETLRQGHREIKIEGEETLVLKLRDDKPAITSVEQVMPGDST